MELVFGELMFSVNFLNKPGIQSDTIIVEEKINLDETKENSKNIKGSKVEKLNNDYFSKYIAIFIILFFVFLYFIIEENFLHQQTDKQTISISYLLKMMNSEKIDVKLKSIISLNNKIKIIFNSSSDKHIYEKLNLLNQFDVNAKALINKNDNLLQINQDWVRHKDKSWNLNKLKQFISDFKGIKSDLYNNKLIIVSDFNNLISIFESFDDLRISHLFKFNIDLINNQNENYQKYYKFIIENYD